MTCFLRRCFNEPYTYFTQNHLNQNVLTERFWFWHQNFGKGVLTVCGMLLQPNTEETKFIKQAPYLDRLDPCTVHRWYSLLATIGHNYGVYIPPYEQHGPHREASWNCCVMTRLTPICRRGFAVMCLNGVKFIHNHLNKDKVVPSNHPYYQEIRYDPNGYHALQILLSPYHPAYTENHVLVAAHPQQGKRSLEEHFRQCQFHYRIQKAFSGTEHDWGNEVTMTRFLESCVYGAYLRTMWQQERHVPSLQYKYRVDRLVATFKEHLASDTFRILNPRAARPVESSALATRPTDAGRSRYRFASKSGTAATRRSGKSGDASGGPTKTVHAIDASVVDELTDDEHCDDASRSSTVDLLDVQAMTFACLLCGEQHDPYKCGLLKGDAEAQRKVFANLREKRRAATKVHQVAITGDGSTDDPDLISFDDSDLELDFR